MTTQRLKQIQDEVEWKAQEAAKILEGDRDNYDGADGARYIRDLCSMCSELIAAVKAE